ncbi:hypothetical protein F5879DRAFT_881122 [Lentinula edodes]|nr:hypothetical protein F5879DRAFT_881122 [Lentinula edodes]
MLDDDDVYIGTYLFCRAHGCEFCNECCIDHRFTNNLRMMDKLHAAFPTFTETDFMNRPPISYILDKAVETKSSRPKERVYECREHNKTDCSICFDWAKLTIDNMKRQNKLKNSKAIAVDITRQEKMNFLHSMGIELLPSTRLPDDAIERKFRGAIDASQSFSKLIQKPPFNPSSFPLWSKKNASKSLLDSVKRGNMMEAFANAQARSQGKENAWDMYENVFVDIRQTIMSLASGFDKGVISAIAQDKDYSYAICIRVVEVRQLDNGVPAIVVLYCRGTRDTPANDTIPWVQEVLSKSVSKTVPLLQIVASLEEQKLLLAILNMNARRLSDQFSPNRSRSEGPFGLSFLLPLAPLGQQDVGALTNHTGCTVCGKKTTSRCSQCLSAEYCGTECQKLHWKEHKSMCNSLKGGEWITVTFSMLPLETRLAAKKGEKLYFTLFNKSSGLSADANRKVYDTDNPPPIPSNIHGDNSFLVKLQKGMSVIIYDRTRSLQAYLCSDVDPKGYEKAMAQMNTGPRGIKVYRWAKRIGDSQLSVCINKAPLIDPQW